MSKSVAATNRFAAALERLAGDHATLVVLAQIAAEDASTMMAQMQSAIEREDLETLARLAHKLKGLLSTFETGDPVANLQSLIDSARNEESKASRRVLDELQCDLEGLIDEIKSLALRTTHRVSFAQD